MVMFLTGTRDFTQMLCLTHVIDVMGIVMTLCAAFDFAYVKKITREQKVLSIGSAFFGLFAVLSMFLFLFGKDMNYMFLITIGFLILFGMHIVTSLLKLSTSLKEHSKLLESERNSYKDQLTSLGNRRLLYRKIAKLEALGIDNETNFIMIDVNGLKVINDSFGHDAGDELLRGTAICMTEAFPDAELICRLGGDEFFIIIKEEQYILDRRMQRFTNYAANWNGKTIKSISVSYGIANRAKYPGLSITELQKAADTEMYQAKSNFYKNKSELSEALDGRR
jgi:diguanylate cyclase (GGDEF)-like protein